MIKGRILYHKYEKLKPMEVLNPKWSWKAKTSDYLYQYFVANRILSVFVMEAEKVLCKVEIDTGDSKHIVVDIREGCDHYDSHSHMHGFEKLTIEHLENGANSIMEPFIRNNRTVSKWIEMKSDDNNFNMILLNGKIREITQRCHVTNFSQNYDENPNKIESNQKSDGEYCLALLASAAVGSNDMDVSLIDDVSMARLSVSRTESWDEYCFHNFTRHEKFRQ